MSPDAAWTELLAELRRRLSRPGLEPAVVDDLVQQAALRLVRGVGARFAEPGGWRDEAQRGAYLRRVVHSVQADHFRRQRPAAPEAEVAVEPAPARHEELTDQVADWLPHFVEQLPEPYRSAMREVELNGTSQRELADRLGLSSSGVRTRVQRGRKRLRALVDACCALTWEDEEVVGVARHPTSDCACPGARVPELPGPLR
ncbi:MAG: sigma-70 family RNA polymerase sigma factor [Myxococcota bacterium]